MIPAPDGRIYSVNSDHGAGHFRTSKRRWLARKSGAFYARQAGIPPLARARVETVIRIRNWQHADPQNYSGGATLKGILDGLVDAKVVVDDGHRYLDVVMPVMAKPTAPRQYEVELLITDIGAGAA